MKPVTLGATALVVEKLIRWIIRYIIGHAGYHSHLEESNSTHVSVLTFSTVIHKAIIKKQ